MGSFSSKCRLRMATFSSGVFCFRRFFMRSLHYLQGERLLHFRLNREQGSSSLARGVARRTSTPHLFILVWPKWVFPRVCVNRLREGHAGRPRSLGVLRAHPRIRWLVDWAQPLFARLR